MKFGIIDFMMASLQVAFIVMKALRSNQLVVVVSYAAHSLGCSV